MVPPWSCCLATSIALQYVNNFSELFIILRGHLWLRMERGQTDKHWQCLFYALGICHWIYLSVLCVPFEWTVTNHSTIVHGPGLNTDICPFYQMGIYHFLYLTLEFTLDHDIYITSIRGEGRHFVCWFSWCTRGQLVLYRIKSSQSTIMIIQDNGGCLLKRKYYFIHKMAIWGMQLPGFLELAFGTISTGCISHPAFSMGTQAHLWCWRTNSQVSPALCQYIWTRCNQNKCSHNQTVTNMSTNCRPQLRHIFKITVFSAAIVWVQGG